MTSVRRAPIRCPPHFRMLKTIVSISTRPSLGAPRRALTQWFSLAQTLNVRKTVRLKLSLGVAFLRMGASWRA